MRAYNLSGVIMYRDIELCYFQIKGGFITYEIADTSATTPYVPFEFRDGYTASSVYDWVNDRLPEDGRQGLLRECLEYGIQMNGDDILKFNNGRVIDDPCWIKFKTGPQTYQEVLDAKYK